MVSESVAAGLSLSLAIEALRLIHRIIAKLEIAGDDGRELLCVFRCSPELHDRLCAFGAATEDLEDDGTAEDCHRTSPREMPPRPATVEAPERLRPAPPLPAHARAALGRLLHPGVPPALAAALLQPEPA